MQGLNVLALDEKDLLKQQRQRARKNPKDVSEGFSLGVEALGKAVAGGLRGLVVEPTKGIEKSGFSGLVQGKKKQ